MLRKDLLTNEIKTFFVVILCLLFAKPIIYSKGNGLSSWKYGIFSFCVSVQQQSSTMCITQCLCTQSALAHNCMVYIFQLSKNSLIKQRMCAVLPGLLSKS